MLKMRTLEVTRKKSYLFNNVQWYRCIMISTFNSTFINKRYGFSGVCEIAKDYFAKYKLYQGVVKDPQYGYIWKVTNSTSALIS